MSLSGADIDPGTKTIEVFLPTYRLKPEENEKFYPSKAKLIMTSVLEEELRDRIDEKSVEDWADFGDEFESLTKEISDKIKQKCKAELNIPRYKIIVQVTIGQMKNQGVSVGSRCLWDTATDNYASARFQNQYIWASAVVFGIYTD
mmetsp:Transcript_14308/g.30167  ORF Transcript_14308/g.30167 Transcript_14308/m.30167 type:complete len:146 (+) Transcript_14308:1072-1509(+)|eukprot:CAMPEP_0171408312 /NCGR_PEP_ID=MMETSP0880-20121228/21789_1 /TAXON_ID=67004 /ORGANISM="Thalassiosira weissflogii, Strain CCMP1336" /LENGTH=145 /DNA_ID=CAMNT_0011924497 /DNA_START=60 /DNA_END=497 /DNA_ORIENTATION=-